MRDAWARAFILVALAASGTALGQTASQGTFFSVELPQLSYALLDAPLSLSAGECGSTRALVVNSGNATARLRLAAIQFVDAASAPPDVAVRVVPATLELSPNATAEIAIHACAFPDAAEGASNFSVDIVAIPPGAPVGTIPMSVTVEGAPGEYSLPSAWWWAVAAAGGAIASWVALRRVEWLRFAALAALAPLYSRLAPSSLLDHRKRETIYKLVEQEPGIHFSALLAQTGLPNGVLVHHLRQLERHRLIASRREGALRRFAVSLAHVPPPPPKPLTPMQARVLDLLAARPHTQREIAAALGLTQQGANRHVKALERRGLLAIRYHEGTWLCHATTPPLQS